MDAIFKALADETRREILDLLKAEDGRTLTNLEMELNEGRDPSRPMTRFGVMKHLRVLEDANLVVSRRAGRFKHHHLNVVPLQELADRWIDPMLAAPSARALITLKTALERSENMSTPSNSEATRTEDKPSLVQSTYIRCTQDRLWDALTNPETIMAYHFITCTVTGAANAVGDRLEHTFPDGSAMLGQEVISLEPKSRIELTFEPGWYGPGAPTSRIVMEIEPIERETADTPGLCRLTVQHWELPPGQEDVRDGWDRDLASLKSWLETGERLHFPSPA